MPAKPIIATPLNARSSRATSSNALVSSEDSSKAKPEVRSDSTTSYRVSRRIATHFYTLAAALWYFLLATLIFLLATARTGATDGLDVHFVEGFSQPNRVSNLATTTTGIVDQLVAKEGDAVSKGDCIVKLRDEIHQQLLKIAELSKEARGESDAAKAELKSSTHRVQIIRKLAQRGSATPEELLRAESEYELAIANLKSIEEKLLLRDAEYEKTKA